MSEQFGHYVLETMIGRGGMGEVYRAYDTKRDRTVALKRLPKDLASDEIFQARFRRECRLVARLNEPHVIPIHDFGEINGHLYLDMRLVEGVDLSTVISDEGPIEPRLAVDVIGQVAAALQSAHDLGLIHRDIKPSNVLVTGLTADRQSAFAYLVDFGIARSEGAGGGTALTATTGTVGTLGYMAPERISGGDGDNRSDLYSLACVLYECLTGHSPFKGETFQVMYAHVNAPPPLPSSEITNLPRALDDVIRKGLAKDPKDRFQTANEFAVAARAALAQGGVTPPPPPMRPPLGGPPPPGGG
ncbi:serine/threonine-protein kinase, partial [uncultured Jatrophihabitans sp.]|uniref:serine/threonine-protein kinase n=1 Tax=uncultured Jatrophihabitans sp. TaxID=1610747 RepID=UPI0035CC0037